MNTEIVPCDVVDKFYEALENRDLQGAVACCNPDAVFWHNFDGVAQSLEQAKRGWESLIANFQANYVTDVRREMINSGVVQRHMFVMLTKEGHLTGKPCCILVRLKEGLIERLDEYINLAGDLPVPGPNEVTAGLPKNRQII